MRSSNKTVRGGNSGNQPLHRHNRSSRIQQCYANQKGVEPSTAMSCASMSVLPYAVPGQIHPIARQFGAIQNVWRYAWTVVLEKHEIYKKHFESKENGKIKLVPRTPGDQVLCVFFILIFLFPIAKIVHM